MGSKDGRFVKDELLNAVGCLVNRYMGDVAKNVLYNDATNLNNLKPQGLVSSKLHLIYILHPKGKLIDALKVKNFCAFSDLDSMKQGV